MVNRKTTIEESDRICPRRFSEKDSMCGIVGVISKKGDNVVPLIQEMLTSITCRGPDGAGIAASSRIALSDSISGLNKGMKLSSDAALGYVRLEVVGGELSK